MQNIPNGAAIVTIIVLIITFFASPLSFAHNSSPFQEISQTEIYGTVGFNTLSGLAQERPLSHICLPLDQIQILWANSTPQFVKNALWDSRHQCFRWLFHPHDRVYRQKILDYLRQQGLSPRVETYLLGLLTSSRSLFVREPGSRQYFSLKTSNSHAPGMWSDRPQQIRSAVSSRYMSDYLESVTHRLSPEVVVPLPEPGLITFPEINLAQNIRLYPGLNEREKGFFPLQAIYSQWGEQLARRWIGPSASFSELRDRLMNLMGEAVAEMAVYFGVMPSSSHWQNFGLELDRFGIPTGKIVWRDHADSHLFEPIVLMRGGAALLEHTKFIRFSNRLVYNHELPLTIAPWLGYLQVEQLPLSHPLNHWRRNQEEYLAWTSAFAQGIQSRLKAMGLEQPIELKPRHNGHYLVFSIADEAGVYAIMELAKKIERQAPLASGTRQQEPTSPQSCRNTLIQSLPIRFPPSS